MIRKMFLVFMQKVLLKSQIDPPYDVCIASTYWRIDLFMKKSVLKYCIQWEAGVLSMYAKKQVSPIHPRFSLKALLCCQYYRAAAQRRKNKKGN